MIAMEKRKRWARETARKLRRAVRGVDYADMPGEPASAAEVAEHRKATAVPQVYVSPLERYVEHRIVPWARSVCLREPRLRNRQPLNPDSPISDRTLLDTASACDWLVLWAEVIAWCYREIVPENAELSDEDRKYITEITGNFPSQIVARWCNHILAGKGNRRERPRHDYETDGGSWDNAVRVMEE